MNRAKRARPEDLEAERLLDEILTRMLAAAPLAPERSARDEDRMEPAPRPKSKP